VCTCDFVTSVGENLAFLCSSNGTFCIQYCIVLRENACISNFNGAKVQGDNCWGRR